MYLLDKMLLNYGFNAYKSLGFRLYSKQVAFFFKAIVEIIRTKNLAIIDKQFSKYRSLEFKDVFGKSLKIDPLMNDTAVVGDSGIFGQIREMIVKNCYLKLLNITAESEFQIVVDLGANRGMFSLMMSNLSGMVYMVENNPNYKLVIENNFKTNNFSNYTLSNQFIGNSGMNYEKGMQSLSFTEWVNNQNINRIDLLKIDIEGSEFSIFQEKYNWNTVHFITMEIHPKCGNPIAIIDKLIAFGFEVIVTDSMQNILQDYSQADYVYATNKNWT